VNGIKEIPLHGKYANGRKALVDEELFADLDRSSWSVGNTGYARCTREGKQLLMHDLIFPAPPGMMVDHINQNKVDNRRQNLRHVTKSQNMQNKPKLRNNTSGFKGVYYLRSGTRTKRWFAKLITDGQIHQSEYVATPDEAAKLYEALATKYQGNYKSTI
jgi:hypothetical protein